MLCTGFVLSPGFKSSLGKVKSISNFFVSVLNSQQKTEGMLLHTTVSWVVEDSKQHSVMLSVLIRLSKYLQPSKDLLSLYKKFSCSYILIILYFTKKNAL